MGGFNAGDVFVGVLIAFILYSFTLATHYLRGDYRRSRLLETLRFRISTGSQEEVIQGQVPMGLLLRQVGPRQRVTLTFEVAGDKVPDLRNNISVANLLENNRDLWRLVNLHSYIAEWTSHATYSSAFFIALGVFVALWESTQPSDRTLLSGILVMAGLASLNFISRRVSNTVLRQHGYHDDLRF